jgi:hypothetical protein
VLSPKGTKSAVSPLGPGKAGRTRSLGLLAVCESSMSVPTDSHLQHDHVVRANGVSAAPGYAPESKGAAEATVTNLDVRKGEHVGT